MTNNQFDDKQIYSSGYWGDNNQGNNGPDFNNFNNRNNGNNGNNNSPKKFSFGHIILAILFLSFMYYFATTIFNNLRTVPYSKFLSYLEAGEVESVDINDGSIIKFELKRGEPGRTVIPYNDTKLIEDLKKSDVEIKGSLKQPSILDIIITLLPILILVYIVLIIIRQSRQFGSGTGGFMSQMTGGSVAREYKPNGKDAVRFSDVAGLKEAKLELEEVVDFLKDPKKFSNIGARIPRGVLLVGPPGTGKTLIARAVAGESKVSFLYTSGSDFVEMFVGMGASRVRSLFAEAKKKSPCIVFIDELDAVGRSRGGSGFSGGHDEREQTLNQILVEMDGFDNQRGIIVMAATNRADVLDDALLRPGRFDRRVSVELPDIKEREDILGLHFAKIKTDGNIDLKRIARATPGTSGADLANLANESALLAARNNKPFVTMSEVELARDKILLGIARISKYLTPEQKTFTAYHEAGHTLLHYYLEGVDPLHKVTIIPHGNAGGLTMSLPEDDQLYRNKTNLLGWIKITMGGYVAEEIVYGQTSTGPSADIKQATRYARAMVTELGMSSLGFVSYANDESSYWSNKPYGESTAKLIDDEIRKILDDCLKDVRGILTQHRDQLDAIAQHLVEKETLDDNEIRAILGLESVEKASDLS